MPLAPNANSHNVRNDKGIANTHFDVDSPQIAVLPPLYHKQKAEYCWF